MTSSASASPYISKQLEQPLLVASHLTKSYPIFKDAGQRLRYALLGSMWVKPEMFTALEDVTFSVQRGEALAVIGRNGAGKSTLLQILAGVVTPSSGSLEVSGRTAGLLELGSGFNPEFTGRENVYLNAAILGLSRRKVDEKFDEIIAFAEIGEFIDQPVKTYSSGMFLRLAFSVAINVEPDLLLVDEALTVGDVFFQQKCYQRLEALRENGMAVLLVTHSMADAAEFCNRGIVLAKGRAVYHGSGKEAVEYYFHHERDIRPSSGSRKAAAPSESASLSDVADLSWMVQPEAVGLSLVDQFGSGCVKALSVLVTDDLNQPRRVFEQGAVVRILTAYKTDGDLDVPLSGIQLFNSKGVLVHSRNTLQFEASPPGSVVAGSIIVSEQTLRLDIDVGEYSIDVGLADTTSFFFGKRSLMVPGELMQHVRLQCHVHKAVAISVVYRSIGEPCLFSHFGIANLPSSQSLTVSLPPDAEAGGVLVSA